MRDSPDEATAVPAWATRLAYGAAIFAAGSCSAIAVVGVAGAARSLTSQPPLTDFWIYVDQVRRIAGDATTLNARWYYPPFAALLFWPFRALSTSAAIALWSMLQLALLVAFGRACWRVLPGWPIGARSAAVFGLVLGCYPIVYCLSIGQVGLLVSVLALWTLRGGSMLWLALAISTKVYPGLYAMAYLVRGRVRSLVLLSAWVVAWSVCAPWLWLGTHASGLLAHNALHVLQRTTGPRFDDDQTVDALITRLFYARSLFDDQPTALLVQLLPLLVMGLGMLASLALAAYALWRTRARDTDDPCAIAAIMLAFTLLVKPGWAHYFVVLPYAQAVLLAQARGRATRSACAVSIGLSLLPMFSLVQPSLLPVLESYGVVTWSALSAVFGLCELDRR